MNIEQTVENLIKNRQAIYKLYKERIYNGSFGLTEKELKDIPDPFFFFMDILLKKEEEYIEILNREDYFALVNEIEKLYEILPSIDENLIVQYIESGSNFLPYLRVIRILNIILSEKTLPIECDEENSDTLPLQKEQKYESVSETVIDQIWPELEQQYLAHFINIAFEKQGDYINTPYERMMRELPYDFIYLSSFCESHFVYDGISNASYTLFLVEDIYPSYFLANKIGREAISEDAIEKIRIQLLSLAKKKETLTMSKAILRDLYIEVLCAEVEEGTLEDLIMNMQDIIDEIKYPMPIIKNLRQIRDNCIVYEDDKDMDRDSEEKVKRMK